LSGLGKPFIVAPYCQHLKGTFVRRGNFGIIECEHHDYQVIIDLDTPAAYLLFEGGQDAIQRFGIPLKCATAEDEERLEEWRTRKFGRLELG
jgi:hypothetical protein